jgi:hypothetical protein
MIIILWWDLNDRCNGIMLAERCWHYPVRPTPHQHRAVKTKQDGEIGRPHLDFIFEMCPFPSAAEHSRQQPSARAPAR